jgi:ParB family transcriptional regulator, chromosome partitioning protein
MTNIAEKTAPPNEPLHVDKRRALGRGLDSLLPAGPRVVAGTAVANPSIANPALANLPLANPPNASPRVASDHVATLPELHAQAAAGEAVAQIPLELIDSNPYQTRREFREAPLAELAESIRASGVVQPVVVRQGANGRYLLILGERRCRASKLAGKATIPAIVRSVSELQAAEITIIENLQRQDLNCMEQAFAFLKLSTVFKLTQEQIGRRVGISRESVANYIRLVRLPERVQQYLQEGHLGFSEARVLLQLDDDKEALARVADTAVRKYLSVEQLEDLVEKTKHPPLVQSDQPGRAKWQDPNVRALQSQLERILGVRVRIRDYKGKGTIRIEYATLEDFDRVMEMLSGKKVAS